MLDKFINIKDKKITVGQTSSGYWYCKEADAENTQELKNLIGDINAILNEYNNKAKEKGKK